MLEALLFAAVTYLVLLIEAVGTVAIGVAVLLSILPFLSWAAAGGRAPLQIRLVRARLGRGLVLGLEFLIGADILKTLLSPSLSEVAVLGAIIILRTILSVSIEYELRHLDDTTPRSGEKRPDADPRTS